MVKLHLKMEESDIEERCGTDGTTALMEASGQKIDIIIITNISITNTIIMACRHIPTMTISHHSGEMSIIKVGMYQYQYQIPTIHDKLQLQHLALVSCSTRPQC